jgi:hypothetical protein
MVVLTLVYGQCKIVDIFLQQSRMVGQSHANPADKTEDTGHFKRGIGKGMGVFVLGVTMTFIVKDTFGHNDGLADCGIFCIGGVAKTPILAL